VTRVNLSVAVIASAALLLAGCGGGPSSPGVAHLSNTSGGSAADSGGAATTGSSAATGDGAASPGPSSLEAAALAFAGCMRSNGVPNFPDPSGGGGFLFHRGAGIDPSSPAFKAAQAKCRKFMPGGGPPGPGSTTHPSAQALAKMLTVSQCMRRHGIPDFPDPKTSVPSNPFGSGGPGVISDIEGVILVFPGTIDTQSQAFTRAAAACEFPLHNH
jgi:hypothetical protein